MNTPRAYDHLSDRAVLLAQADELERFAARETASAFRNRFWRAAAALRACAEIARFYPTRLAEICADIDRERAKR